MVLDQVPPVAVLCTCLLEVLKLALAAVSVQPEEMVGLEVSCRCMRDAVLLVVVGISTFSRVRDKSMAAACISVPDSRQVAMLLQSGAVQSYLLLTEQWVLAVVVVMFVSLQVVVLLVVLYT